VRLFETVTRQLDRRGVVVRTGPRVDATRIPSVGLRHEGEARRAGPRRKKPLHRTKAPVATDQEAGRIRGLAGTTATVQDAAEWEAIRPEEPGETQGDSAYAGGRSDAIICAQGGVPQGGHTGTWGGAEARARLEAHKAKGRRVRGRIEKVFGPAKRSYGLRRRRWGGLAKAGLQVRLVAIASTLRRSWRWLAIPAA
jgi:IS5 family transposase